MYYRVALFYVYKCEYVNPKLPVSLSHPLPECHTQEIILWFSASSIRVHTKNLIILIIHTGKLRFWEVQKFSAQDSTTPDIETAAQSSSTAHGTGSEKITSSSRILD